MVTIQRRVFLSLATILSTMALGFVTSELLAAFGHHRCCCRCSCPQSNKICRLVREEKKVTIECWGCLEEDFCAPGRSVKGCCHCETICAECVKAGETKTKPKAFKWSTWHPNGCAEMYTRKKLMKKTVTKKIPSYKWVVEDLCKECLSKEEPVKVAADAVIPPIPQVAEDVEVLASFQTVPAEADSIETEETGLIDESFEDLSITR